MATSEQREIAFFADYVCPFSYMGWLGLERVRQELGIVPVFRAFELRPPGTAAPTAPVEAEWALVDSVAREAGVVVRRPAFVPRTRKAHEATKHVARLGLAAAWQRAIFDAYFVQGRDIGRIDVLVDIAGLLGLDRMELKVALDVDAHADDVAGDRALAEALEIGGTPAYVAGADVRVGLLTDEHLREWLRN